MTDTGVEDLFSLDRDVGRAATALARWRARLAKEPEDHAGEDPIEPYRRVAGKSTWDALRALAPGAADAPLRDALVPWVGTLAMARIGREDDVALARAAAERTAAYRGDPPGLASWREAWRGVVSAATPAEARLWLETAAEAAPRVAAAATEGAARRLEIAKRLGLAHPWDLAGAGQPVALGGAARRLLDGTQDVATQALREALPDAVDAASVMHLALGREASEGWPARLAPRWLEEVFGAPLAGLRIDLPALPEATGAASFMRALRALGSGVRLAMTPTALPFALARDPASRAAHRLGAVFAGLAADAEWQARALGLGWRSATRQARVLARTALLEARLAAARLLLGDETSYASRDAYEELGPRLYGAPLDPRLRGAWPWARRDEPARFVALLESLGAARALTEAFDVDWYRNPRAWAHLRAASAGPAREPADDEALPAAVDALARAFEGALG